MATLKLTPAAASVRDALVAEIVPAKCLDLNLDAVVRAASRRDVPYSAYHAAYGIAWAVQTGRVGGVVEKALRDLTWKKLAALLGRLATECEAMDRVPATLIALFAA